MFFFFLWCCGSSHLAKDLMHLNTILSRPIMAHPHSNQEACLAYEMTTRGTCRRHPWSAIFMICMCLCAFQLLSCTKKTEIGQCQESKGKTWLKHLYKHNSIYVANICQSLSNFKSFDIFSVFSSFDVFDLFCSVQPRRPEPNDRQSLYLPRISKGMEDLDGSEDSVSLPWYYIFGVEYSFGFRKMHRFPQESVRIHEPMVQSTISSLFQCLTYSTVSRSLVSFLWCHAVKESQHRRQRGVVSSNIHQTPGNSRLAQPFWSSV